jgi:hypothetical protein
MDVLVVGNFILEKKLTSGVPEENANNFAKRAK